MSRATHRTGLLGFALAALAVMFLMAPPDASAQAVSGTILGTVKDTSGAVVPGFNVDTSIDGFAPYVVGTIPLGPWFEIYGRAGYFFYDATVGVDF